MKKFFSFMLVLSMILALGCGAFADASDNYNLTITAEIVDGKPVVEVYNGNNFKVNDITLTVTCNGEQTQEVIGSIDRLSAWKTGDETADYAAFVPFGYVAGEERVIDFDLYDAENGIYNAADPNDFQAVVWPDDDTDEEWSKKLYVEFPEINTSVTAEFVAYGPRLAFSGHSFTGYWDSSYYYLRELAKMGGYNAQLAYSYWGGTGLAHHAGLIEGTEPRAEQNDKLFAANEYYDFYTVAGNSNEALSTTDQLVGSTNYSQRDTMEAGARILWDKANAKDAQVILWSTRGYRYGFFTDLSDKPWHEGNVGDKYVTDDGKEYILSMTSKEMATENAKYYTYLAENIGDGSSWVAQIGTAYNYINENYSDLINPYLTKEQGYDWGHQNNLGNYIAACVLYGLIFNESPEGLGIPESHTWGMAGGPITEEQAAIIQEVAWKVVSGEYSLLGE